MSRRRSKQADVIVEGEYRTGHQEQLYIEPNGVIAVPENGGVTIYGSLQCPFYVHKAVRIALGLPDERVRIVQTETGGGFGGKEEYPSVIAAHAALLALKANRPVKLVYRPARGHARDDEAAPVDRAASHGRHARWPARRDGHRHSHGRRRVRHAEPRRPLARDDPRRRALPLRPRAA